MRFRHRAFAGLLMLGVLGTVGCGGAGFAPVSGRITLNNQPLTNAIIDFQPMAPSQGVDPGPGSTAKTDGDGRYTLHSALDRGQVGAVIGKHVVRISKMSDYEGGADADAGGPKRKKTDPWSVPSRYNIESKLTFEVPSGGTDKADFALTSP